MLDVVTGLIIREHKILIAKRPQNKPYSGFWEFPGGKVESSETQLQALKRELQEELGILVAQAQFRFSVLHHYPERSVTLHVWRVTNFLGEPQGLEGQDVRWINLNELTQFTFPQANYKIVAELAHEMSPSLQVVEA